MSTIAQARAALSTLVGASDDAIDPPAVYVFSNGSELNRLGGVGVEWEFRVTCVVGIPGNNAQASDALATLIAAKLSALNAPSVWRVLSVSREGTTEVAGSKLLAADIAVSTKVEI